MNILYCGDSNIEQGLMLSILSLLEHVKEELHIYVLTMELCYHEKCYQPVSDACIDRIKRVLESAGSGYFIQKIDVTKQFHEVIPLRNMDTRFTPYCMLRLYADEVTVLPDKILYLDNDVLCLRDCQAFYHQDIEEYEFAGVLDYYGSWLFRRRPLRFWNRDYVNSGVLLLNLKKIRETGLFSECRVCCSEKKMFMPDQSAINKCATLKKIDVRKYNEQRKMKPDTVFQHFTTSFRFFPWFHMVKVKPWQFEQVHQVLGITEYDDIFEQYRNVR